MLNAQELRESLLDTPVGAGVDEVLRRLSQGVRFGAGFVDQFRHSNPVGGVTSFYNLPNRCVERVMAERNKDSALVLRFVALAKCGKVVRHRDLSAHLDWSTQQGYTAVAEAGFPEAAAMKISTTPVGVDQEHTYIALLRSARTGPLTSPECELLGSSWQAIATALERALVPLLASDPILLQVAAEKKMGLACVAAKDHRLLASNYLAHVYANTYGPALGATSRANPLHAFLHKLTYTREAERPFQPSQQLPSLAGNELLHVRCHKLAHNTHNVGEEVLLITMQQFAVPQSAATRLIEPLPTRLRQLAYYMVRTGLSYKEIAEVMVIAQPTVHSHVRRLFERLNVTSRQELVKRLITLSKES